MANLLDDILRYNHTFVEEKGYEPYVTSKFPDKKAVILTCMDTRLTELLPKAIHLHNGEMKIIKNAGAVITNPSDSVVRSILVALYELTAEEVFIIGHHGCGMTGLTGDRILEKAYKRSSEAESIHEHFEKENGAAEWLTGFESEEENIKESVDALRRHPLLPDDTRVHGLLIDPETGKLDLVVDGNKEKA
ncbi:beta-class carbonic anhydrase [Salsuginibacillus kocurii]|uniref:beta-class carbonic anhydrase n=1 Tax=Salsuginibacillus kocurii TaxID=427078 RepID=UPI00037BF349